MEFVWDTQKEAVNRRKHGILFATAARIFDDPHAVSYVDHVVDGETRWHTIGMSGGITLVLVVHTVEEGDEETIRIISARKANSGEQALYFSSHER